MEMMCHQHIGMNGTIGFLCVFLEPALISPVVIVVKPAHLTIIATLDQLKWDSGQNDAGPSWLIAFLPCLHVLVKHHRNRGLSPIVILCGLIPIQNSSIREY